MNSRLSLSLLALLLAAACPKPVIINPNPGPAVCEDNEQCSAGSLCVGGTCLIASCDPAIEDLCDLGDEAKPETCCRVFENCDDVKLECKRDPNAEGIGCPGTEPDCTPCDKGNDCFEELGFDSFCSGGRCFETAGRTECTEDFQCSNGDRCDRSNFFCVPDAGGCRFCEDFPELCCDNGQVCDEGANACIEIDVDDQCTPETAAALCRPDQVCDASGRCVFCIDDEDCGVGTVCNIVQGKCVGAVSACNLDEDCFDINPVLRCIDSTCAAPQCEEDGDCFGDDREVCEGFQCVLPPAVCTETDEPNNSPQTATALPDLLTGYGGTLCRGDTDFISFPVQPLKRYTVTVTVATSPFRGITATLFNSTGGRESDATFEFTSSLPVLGVTSPDETGRFVVSVSSAGATEEDSWRYSVTVAEAAASPEPDCSANAPGVINHEPNNTAATATVLTSGTALDVTRCATNDDDFFKIAVPPQHGVQVIVDNFLNAEGNLNPALLSGPAPGVAVVGQSPTGSANIETLVSPEGVSEYIIKVALGTTVGALPSQSYRIVATTVPRPAACDADLGENDDALADAEPLVLTTTDGLVAGSVSPLRCNPQDIDLRTFTIPARLGGTLRLTSTHSSGDMKLELLSAAGALLLTSNAANGIEAIDLPQALVDVDYVARVSLGSTASPNATAQTYTLSVVTFSAGSCLASEPTADNTFATARCVGAFSPGTFPCNGPVIPVAAAATLVSCEADDTDDGCYRSCGNSDLDVYRVGTLASGRTVTARLEFDPAEGDLSVEIAKVTNGVPGVAAASARDTDNDGLINFEFLTTNAPKEHIITIRPQGATGHEAQLYALQLGVSDACEADEFDAGANNSNPATATLLREDAAPADVDDSVDATICNGDVADVYEIFAFTDETITARITGPVGVRLRVGRRPNPLTAPAVTIAERIIPAGGSIDVTVVSPSVQQLYFTVDRPGGAGAGDYSLVLDYTP